MYCSKTTPNEPPSQNPTNTYTIRQKSPTKRRCTPRARIAKSVRFSHKNIVHRYCPEYRKIHSHKSQSRNPPCHKNPTLNDITTMTNSTALNQLELAEARKRKADEQEQKKQKVTNTKKTSCDVRTIIQTRLTHRMN